MKMWVKTGVLLIPSSIADYRSSEIPPAGHVETIDRDAAKCAHLQMG